MVFYLSEVDVFSILLLLDAEKPHPKCACMYSIRKRLSCSNIRDSEVNSDFVNVLTKHWRKHGWGSVMDSRGIMF